MSGSRKARWKFTDSIGMSDGGVSAWGSGKNRICGKSWVNRICFLILSYWDPPNLYPLTQSGLRRKCRINFFSSCILGLPEIAFPYWRALQLSSDIFLMLLNNLNTNEEQSFGLCGRGSRGMIWENGIKMCIISYKKLITSLGLMQDTGCLGLVHWDDPEGWYGQGGRRRGSGVGTHGHPWQIHVDVWQNQYNIVK